MPTLSDVRNWDTEHLTAAADHWTKTATVWEDVFTRYWQQIPNPAGTPWTGEAAEAAERQAYSDRMIVIGLANQLHDASAIATAGANELKEACRLVIRSVDAAQNDGFTVGEDFSVSDHNVYSRAAAAMRQAKAEGYAADIRAAVADLVAADQRIATAITAAASGLGKDHFGELGGPTGPRVGDNRKSARDALLANMAGGTPPQKDVAEKTTTDSLLGNFADAGEQLPLANSLLANVAGGGSNSNTAAQTALYQIGKATVGDKKDWLFATSSAYTSTLINGAAELARPGAAEAPSWVQKTVGEVKMGKLSLGSAGGLGLSGMFQGVSFLTDLNKPGMTTTHAVVRNGAALVANTLAQAPFDATVVGIPAGIAFGAVAANATAATVDAVWEPLSTAQEVFTEAGGPGAAMKVARWGW